MLLALVFGCTSPVGSGANPILSGDDFFDRPWPSDDRRTDGRPDLSGFPRSGQYPIVDAYLDAFDRVDGFGNNSPLYVQFDTALDTSLLPTAADSLTSESPVYLLDIGIGSPSRGEKIPLEFEWTELHTSFLPDNTLAIAPVLGFPLRPATRYALVFKSPLVAPQSLDWSDPGLAALESTLESKRVPLDTVSFAVVFTTQDPIAETARISRAIHEEIALSPLPSQLDTAGDNGTYTLYTGTLLMPVWQHGARPYRDLGSGGFAFDDAGAPLIYQWERVAFALTIPDETPPEAGWPVVLYSHGTGGDQYSFCNGSDTDEGLVMARQGVAMFGVSQPLHGDRATPDTSVELDSFNFYNPDAGRSNFRQGALDQVYLARLLSASSLEFETDEGEVHLDPDTLAFFGHSQGGLVGAIGAPFMSEDLLGAGFSGTGGGLTLTVLLRKDPLDISATFEALLGFDEGEHLTRFHPVLALVQTLADATDPVNYAPYWFAEQGPWSSRAAARPMPILLTEGLLDEATPGLTSEALAGAGRLPIVGDQASEVLALDLRGLARQSFPVEANAEAWDTSTVTAGVAQFPDDGHYAIYDNPAATRLYRDFLSSVLENQAVLDD